MSIFKLSSLFLLLIGAFALRDEEVVRSPAIVDEATNDERASTEMELYENEEDADYMENELKFLEDETAILDASDESGLEKRNRIVCLARRLACNLACRRIPRRFRGACKRVCNFGLRFANRAVCFVACRRFPRIIRGICYRVCRCLR